MPVNQLAVFFAIDEGLFDDRTADALVTVIEDRLLAWCYCLYQLGVADQ